VHSNAFASKDTIYTVNGRIIPCDVVEITSSAVKYLYMNEFDSSIFVLYKRDISYITFKNGKHAFYSLDAAEVSAIKEQQPLAADQDKQVKFKNIIGINLVNLVHGNVNFSLERMTRSGHFSLRIPVKIGFDNENGKEYVASTYSGRKVIWSTELGILIYPKGQKRASYVFGLGYEVGELKFITENLVTTITGNNSLVQSNSRDYTFNSFYIYNGLVLSPVHKIAFSFLGGVGGRRTFELDQEYSAALNLSVSVGYRF
tara:strand:+ start:9681 stop:10454 length:774 start_codon:yes stop_codon:yes gene_type:complete